ncbi:MAG: hypothetical protein JKX91_01425 [Rhizobiaceae bacterium]|nr:hypothetical protein [Rhizobiaceae bacterium]
MQDELRQLLAETYESELDGIEIGDDLNLFASGIIDSFSLINFVVALEKKYNIKIPDSDATPDNLGSVLSAEIYLNQKLG